MIIVELQNTIACLEVKGFTIELAAMFQIASKPVLDALGFGDFRFYIIDRIVPDLN